MAITAQFLSQCTDHEINLGMAWLETRDSFELLEEDDGFPFGGGSDYVTHVFNDGLDFTNDECHTFSFMRINRINLISPLEHRDKWTASATNGGGNWSINDFTSTNANPLRAICECYILMSVSK